MLNIKFKNIKLEFGNLEINAEFQYGQIIVKHNSYYLEYEATIEEKIEFRANLEKQVRLQLGQDSVNIFLIYKETK